MKKKQLSLLDKAFTCNKSFMYGDEPQIVVLLDDAIKCIRLIKKKIINYCDTDDEEFIVEEINSLVRGKSTWRQEWEA